MTGSATAADDTAILPVFPLAGATLLPGTFLPLHIFEPRYRAMVRDVLAADKEIGMIQPMTSGEEDDSGTDAAAASALFEVGCVGALEHCRELDDGRFILLLEGRRRFRTVAELAPRNGYRRFAVRYDRFEESADAERPPSLLDPSCTRDVLNALSTFVAHRPLSFDREKLDGLAPQLLIDALSMQLPFSPAEKQALLEAPQSIDRYRILVSLLTMGSDPTATHDADQVH